MRTLSEYLDQHGILLFPSEAANWRAFPKQRLSKLKGQPYVGEVIPRITNGDHVWVDVLKDDSILKVHITNLEIVTGLAKRIDPWAVETPFKGKKKKKEMSKADILDLIL